MTAPRTPHFSISARVLFAAAAFTLASLFPGYARSRVASQSPASSPARKPAAARKALSPRQRARQLYFRTLAAFIEHRDRAKAEQGFLEVVQLDVDFAPAWFNLGVLSEGDKNWTRAEGYFQKDLRLAPNGPDAQRARAQLQILPQYASGTISPEAAKQADYDATIQRARAFLAAGLFREAIAEAGRAQAADQSRWEAYAVVALCMAKQHKADAAARFEARAVSHAPAAKRQQVQEALARQIAKWSH